MRKHVLLRLAPALAFVASALACTPAEDGARQEGTGRPPAASGPSTGASLASLLPGDGAVEGWKRNAEPKSYGTGTLWDFIDGGAEVYLACGFQEVVTSEYASASTSSSVSIDIYLMGSPRGAFGIYSQEASPAYEYRRVGVEGYLAGSALNFWSGAYYVKVTAIEQSEALREELLKLAEAVSAKLGAPGTPPAELDMFPRDGLVPHSVRYLPRNVLGLSELSGGFEARYRMRAHEHALTLVPLEDEKDAAQALARYRTHLSSAGGSVRNLPAAGEAFAGRDDLYGTVVAARRGALFVAATGVPSVELGVDRINALRVPSRSGGPADPR